jgi:hypothetical protein
VSISGKCFPILHIPLELESLAVNPCLRGLPPSASPPRYLRVLGIGGQSFNDVADDQSGNFSSMEFRTYYTQNVARVV